MESTRSSRPTFESMPWALLLIWWGILELIPARPKGIGALGVALILLGVNALRLVTGSDVSRMSTTLGLATLVLSLVLLSQTALHLPFDIPTFPILLIACGAIILAWEVVRPRTKRSCPPAPMVAPGSTSAEETTYAKDA